MRKITELAVDSFMSAQPFRLNNTTVTCDDDVKMYLHGHLIASWSVILGTISITDAGWPTMTTKERLNGLPGVYIQQKAGQWYLNGQKWNGAWTEI